jgi:hypothetical protein
MVEYFSGKRIADNAPIVGADVFTQTAGIHADGDKKGSLYHTRLSPERFARRRKYALGKLAGKASLAKNLERLDISLSEENQRKVLARIVELGDSKKTITIDDLPFIIAEVLDGKDYRHAELLACTVSSSLDLDSTASIKIRLGEDVYNATGSGNGGFDAFTNALGKLLKKHDLALPELTDYEVRIPKGGRTDALTECHHRLGHGPRGAAYPRGPCQSGVCRDCGHHAHAQHPDAPGLNRAGGGGASLGGDADGGLRPADPERGVRARRRADRSSAPRVGCLFGGCRDNSPHIGPSLLRSQ